MSVPRDTDGQLRVVEEKGKSFLMIWSSVANISVLRVGPHHRPGWGPGLDQGAVGDNEKDDIINHHGGDEEQALWSGLRCCRKTELEVEEQRGKGVGDYLQRSEHAQFYQLSRR